MDESQSFHKFMSFKKFINEADENEENPTDYDADEELVDDEPKKEEKTDENVDSDAGPDGNAGQEDTGESDESEPAEDPEAGGAAA